MYLALYRKYRPQTFADVISQEHITTTLTNQLKNGQVAHAYLFTGSRGTGKTTCAKILAKAVNCLSPKDGNPCLECEQCGVVDEGVSDVLEIDAASNNGVDHVRALRDEAMYSPVSCKYRVYIIDEVHMLSAAAFNALLKLIEEPPAHVIFILATTEVHKVPATIVSRCQRFEFRRIDINDSAARLKDISMTEGAELDDSAAYLIAKLSDGGMRDALSLLDQCISVSRRVTAEIVRECAGVAGNDHLFEIADGIAAENTAFVLDRLNSLTASGKDIVRLTEEMIGHYRNLMLLKVNSGTEKLVSAVPEDIQRYKAQNESYSISGIMRCINILSDCLKTLSASRQRSVAAEMCMIKLCSPRLDGDVTSLTARIEALERELKLLREQGVTARREPNVQPAPVPTAAEKPEPPAPTHTEAASTKENAPAETVPMEKNVKQNDAADEIPPPPEPPVQTEPEIPPEPVQTAPQEPVPTANPDTAATQLFSTAEDVQSPSADYSRSGEVNEWADILDSLPFSINVLIGGTTAFFSGNEIVVEGTPIAKSFVVNEYNKQIREAAEKILGRKYAVVAAPDVVEERHDKVSELLAFAEKQGITIKKK